MSGWFCRRGFGPGPSVGTAPLTRLNGLAGPASRRKKNAAMTRSTTSAHVTRGSLSRVRNQSRVATTYRARISVHRRIEPSSELHRLATL